MMRHVARFLARHTRTLVRQPAFALVSIATLALGIGANTAMFSVLRFVLLEPLPLAQSDRLVTIWSRGPQRDQSIAEVSASEQRAWRSGARTFEDLAIFGSVNWSHRITAPGQPAEVPYSSVSGTFFDTLGARPLLGRTLRADDDRPDAPRRAVLSAGLWQRRFDGDRAIVGRRFTVGEGAKAESFEIVGVMPAAFDFPRGAELWSAAAPDRAAFNRAEKERPPQYIEYLRVYYAIGRLTSDATIERARADLNVISAGLRESRTMLTPPDEVVILTPLLAHIFGSARPALYALMGAVGLVLLIACANVASLLLARGVGREREIALRIALGANRRQIVRGLLAEGAIIAALGGLAGAVVAAASLRTLVALSPAEIPRLAEARIDGWVLLFALLVSATTALLVGLTPALQLSKPDLVTSLNRGPRAGGQARQRTRHVLVAGEVALTVVLLVAAGLMMQSFAALARLDLGFNPDKVLTFRVSGPDASYPNIETQRALVRALVDRYQRLPGVVAAGAIYQRPFEHGPVGMDTAFILEGDNETPGEGPHRPVLNWESATPGYFRTMEIRLVRGRLFDDRDTAKSPLVVIVSEAMAARVWPGENPIGKRLRAYGAFAPGLWQTVVGVVETASYREINTPRLDLYLPLDQAPSPVNHYVVRASGDPSALTAALRHETATIDRALTLDGVTTMSRIVERTQGPWRFNMIVFGAFALVALLLSTLGLFGLVAYTVSQRTREIGVRMALGASQTAVVRLMVRQGTWPIVAGLGVGLVAAFAVTRLVASLLFEVSAADPVTFAAVAAGLLAVAVVACYVPARRSAHVDPLVALRVD
jgi:putative ABC transport system permease protein